MAEASLDAEAYHCDAVAAADGRLLCFARSAFHTALNDEAVFNRSWIQLLAREVRRLHARSERLSLNNSVERVLHYIEAEGSDGEVTLNQPHKVWAAELGLTHETLYRTLCQLREGGFLVIDEQRIALSAQKK
jgi:CRP-like cAMP-binding protein